MPDTPATAAGNTRHSDDASRKDTVLPRRQAGRSDTAPYGAFFEFLTDPVLVGNMDGTVAYINPAFEMVFGWTREELAGRRIPFVPDREKAATRAGIERLLAENVLHGFETRRLTRDGRILDVVIDGTLLTDAAGRPSGQVITLRDVSAAKQAGQTNQALLRIARALYRFPQLDQMLTYITGQVQELIRAAGAAVILIDETRQEFYIPVASYSDRVAGDRMRGIRFPVDKGVAGYVYRTGRPLIVPDTQQCPHFYEQVDREAGFRHENMLDVPLRVQDRMIGVLCAVNKQEGAFDDADADLLSAVANVVALPIENARITEALQHSYENVQALNRAKEQVIHHLSHELKTPLSVLSAALGLLEKRLPDHSDPAVDRILGRMNRNLRRLMDMQYEIGDMLRDQKYSAHGMLSFLLAASRDMLVSLIEAAPDSGRAPEAIQATIDREFGRVDDPCAAIALDRLVPIHLETLKPSFTHRRIRLETRLAPAAAVDIPLDVMEKILEGLVRNAIENTPDQGRVAIVVRDSDQGPVLEVQDTGVGMTREKQRLIFNHYFAPGDTMSYASRSPYDFDAGGKGFDLLRITVFSERYCFETRMTSRRCRFIPLDSDVCPGAIERCRHCRSTETCDASGGTTMQIRFRASADEAPLKPPTGSAAPDAVTLNSKPDDEGGAPAAVPPDVRETDPEEDGPIAMAVPDPQRIRDAFFDRIDVEFLVHELKDPLSVIETAVRLLLEKSGKYGALTERQAKTLNRALRNSGRARALLADLLEVGRADAGVFQCSWFDGAAAVDAVLMDVLEIVDPVMWESLQAADAGPPRTAILERYGIHQYCTSAARGRSLCQDETKFRQIVGNLMKNALQHRRRKLEISIDYRPAQWIVDVADDGQGVSKADRELIFQRYIRGRARAPLSRSGHGLGLAGARILARRMGGDIVVIDTPGNGALFRFTLPLSPPGGPSSTDA